MKSTIYTTIRLFLLTIALALVPSFLKADVHQDFLLRKQLVHDASIFKVFDTSLSNKEKSSLEFLYAYMSQPDIADYSGMYFLDNTKIAIKAQNEMPWGKSVSNQLWQHFVLPPRVNNEALDAFRMKYYQELSKRVRNMTIANAALEINHWCHEHVTYKPADARTSSPMATILTGTGRCGEESTLLVAALRTVGIPARQVYTPLWAHTDDNHAWVEVWTGDGWHFMGACEPEPVLDLGWFNLPASRGMLMHTKVFGKYDGPEDVMSVTNCFTEINVTSNYAPVSRVNILIVDENNQPVNGATVEYKIYNYAELSTVATKLTDKNGRSSITAGLGDLVVWGSKNNVFAFSKYSNGKDTLLTLKLSDGKAHNQNRSFTIVPPSARDNQPFVSAQQRERNTQLLAYEDSLRNDYLMSFPDEKQIKQICEANAFDEKVITPFVKKSKGNWGTILNLAEKYRKQSRKLFALLGVLTDKDLRDVNMSMIDDAMLTPCGESIDNFFVHNVLNPRVATEELSAYRQYFSNVISKNDKQQFVSHPEKLIDWFAENIQTDCSWNPQKLYMSPISVYKWRKTDEQSRNVCFVAMARSIGIAARINEINGKVQYADNSKKWMTVSFGDVATSSNKQPMLRLVYHKTGLLDNPSYYSHFTLSKLVKGKTSLMNYDYGKTWKDLFESGSRVDAGTYLLVSGTRMSDGSVLCEANQFDINKDKDVKLVLPTSKTGVQVIGNFNSENLYYDKATSQDKSVLSTTGRGYYALALVRPNHEPTTHLLNELSEVSTQLESWGRPILLLFESKEAMARFRFSDFPQLPKNIVFGVDKMSAVELQNNHLALGDNLPMLLVADTFNRVLFFSQGYNIGLGERLVKTVKQLVQ